MRRARDEKSCGSGHGISAEIEAQRAIQESVVDIVNVDLLPDTSSNKREPSQEITVLDRPSKSAGSHRNIVPRPSTSSKQPRQSSFDELQLRSKHPIQASSGNEWSCTACTLLNPMPALQCAACFSSRPPDSAAGWTCMSCGEQEMPHDFWSCRYCGQVKRES